MIAAEGKYDLLLEWDLDLYALEFLAVKVSCTQRVREPKLKAAGGEERVVICVCITLARSYRLGANAHRGLDMSSVLFWC